ncbi:unnamed protein product [Adineta steineri]|uniref:Solute carrier family 66 member 3 n=1 Tax=Adineta steineri TaxID=433720 RepID=A0A814PSN2_9BILA|nr:unnamed protein product [Adineta steineri]CAF1387183.1 unnamed protein product [Adineta steineri]CAF4112064.1 unnamed protein product [Adineta steineri]
MVLQLLSLSVNILCLIQKVPQIYRIYKTKNVESVSLSSVLLEETAYTLVLTYNLWRNYPLSTFFEYIFLFIQDLLLLWALSKYSTKETKEKGKLNDRSTPLYGILAFSVYLFLGIVGLVPAAWMRICTMLVIPISASSKIVQLRTILSNKSAGQVSRPGWMIACYNNFARIITNLVETRDMSMVLNLFISLILNISIVIACTVYKYGPVRKPKDKKKKKTT